MQKELDNSLCYALSVVCNWICTFVFCESALLTFIWILITIAVFCRDGFLEAGDVRTDFQCKLFICFSIRVCIKLCCSCCNLHAHHFLHGLAYHHNPAKYQTVVNWPCQQPQEDASLWSSATLVFILLAAWQLMRNTSSLYILYVSVCQNYVSYVCAM